MQVNQANIEPELKTKGRGVEKAADKKNRELACYENYYSKVGRGNK